MIWIQAALVFLFSVSNDWIAVLWHRSVEKNWVIRGTLASMAIGTIAWLSIIWVIAESYWLAIPDILGTGVGTYFGIRYQHRTVKATPAGIIMNLLLKLSGNEAETKTGIRKPKEDSE